MSTPNKYDGNGQWWAVRQNPTARYIVAHPLVGKGKPYNIGRNAAKRAEKARRAAVLKRLRRFIAQCERSGMQLLDLH